MLHHFVGVIGLFFALFGWNKNRSMQEWILLIFGLLIGAMSFEFLPVRKWMFDHVPFMNLFLQGAYLRIFMVLSLIFFKWASALFGSSQNDGSRVCSSSSAISANFLSKSKIPPQSLHTAFYIFQMLCVHAAKLRLIIEDLAQCV
jgi:hypothetical protein